MKITILMLVFLLTGCLGDRIPWDIAEVEQSDGQVCVYSSETDENAVFERMKIQKTGESNEFIVNFTEKIYARNSCLPLMGYAFIANNEYNVSFSVIDTQNGSSELFAPTFIAT